jgi:hypothetical protein
LHAAKRPEPNVCNTNELPHQIARHDGMSDEPEKQNGIAIVWVLA